MGQIRLTILNNGCHPEIICQNAIVLVAVRDKMNLAVIRQKIDQIRQLFPAEIYPVSGGKTDISSSLLRQSLAKGQKEASWSLLPDAVKSILMSSSYITVRNYGAENMMELGRNS